MTSIDTPAAVVGRVSPTLRAAPAVRFVGSFQPNQPNERRTGVAALGGSTVPIVP